MKAFCDSSDACSEVDRLFKAVSPLTAKLHLPAAAWIWFHAKLMFRF